MNTSTPTLVVITMVQAKDFPSANISLNLVDPQLSEDRTRIVLFNDRVDSDLIESIAGRPYTSVIAPDENLGVARGRNRLIAAALERNTDWIVSLDDDLFVPTDYLDRLSDQATSLAQGHRVGILGPAVLDHGAFQDAVERGPGDAAYGGPASPLAMDDVHLMMRTTWPEGIPAKVLYHAGIESWRDNYLRINGGLAGDARRIIDDAAGRPRLPSSPMFELKRNPDVRGAVLTGLPSPLEVDVIPGGVCAVSADLVAAIGATDESFSPFGYEDADFAIRARLAGFSNFLLPDLVVLHDFDGRTRRRSGCFRLFVEGRSRALLFRKHRDHSNAAVEVGEMLLLGPLRVWDVVGGAGTARESGAEAFRAGLGSWIAGWVDGATVDAPTSEPLLQDGFNEWRGLVRLPMWSGAKAAGMPGTLEGSVSLSCTWGSEVGELEVHALELDFPGSGHASAAFAVGGLNRDLRSGAIDYRSVYFGHGRFNFSDRTFLEGLERATARRRRDTPDGILRELAQGAQGKVGRRLRWLLSPTKRGFADVSAIVPVLSPPMTVGDYEDTECHNRPSPFPEQDGAAISVEVSDQRLGRARV